MNNRIRIARGENILSNTSEIVAGQPVYDTQKNILRIGSGKTNEKTIATTKPINVEENAKLGNSWNNVFEFNDTLSGDSFELELNFSYGAQSNEQTQCTAIKWQGNSGSLQLSYKKQADSEYTTMYQWGKWNSGIDSANARYTTFADHAEELPPELLKFLNANATNITTRIISEIFESKRNAVKIASQLGMDKGPAGVKLVNNKVNIIGDSIVKTQTSDDSSSNIANTEFVNKFYESNPNVTVYSVNYSIDENGEIKINQSSSTDKLKVKANAIKFKKTTGTTTAAGYPKDLKMWLASVDIVDSAYVNKPIIIYYNGDKSNFFQSRLPYVLNATAGMSENQSTNDFRNIGIYGKDQSSFTLWVSKTGNVQVSAIGW